MTLHLLGVGSGGVGAKNIGDLGLGSCYPATGYGTLASATPGAKAQMWVPTKVLQPCELTGISYVVGGTSNGKVIVAAYGPTGTLLKQSLATAQGEANKVQRVAFESKLKLGEPQIVFLSLLMETVTGTCLSALNLESTAKEVQAEVKVKASLVPPTEPLVSTVVPLLGTY